MPFRNDISVIWSSSPRIIRIAAPSTELTIQDLVDTVREIEYNFDSLDDEPLLYDDTGKDDLGGGVFVGITVTLNDAKVQFEERLTPTVSGIATSTDTTILNDTGASFITDGVSPGATIANLTDGSFATVLRLLSENQLEHSLLQNGSVNSWNPSDNYSVWNEIQCDISGGNLVALDIMGSGMSPVLPSAFTQIVKTSSSSATLQESKDIQYSSFDGGITLDVIAGVSGTTYPIGTPRVPVDNLQDAMAIANERGFTTIYVHGDLTIDSGFNYTGMSFIGESKNKSILTISSAANVEKCEFSEATVTGTLDGESVLKDCYILSLNYINGFIEDCILGNGVITLSGISAAHFLDCYSGVPGGTIPTINCGGDGPPLTLRNYSGGIKLTNKTGMNDVAIDMNTGHIVLDSTVTNGTITIRGITEITDNSTGSAVVNQQAVIDLEEIADAVWDEILSGHITAGSAAEFLQKVGTDQVLSSAQATTLLELYRIYGLDPTRPLIVSPTSRTAGVEIDQTITDNEGTITVQRN